MTKIKGLLIIGGASRNVGKTSLSSSIIRHFSENCDLIGLKIKTLYPEDGFFHGKDNSTVKKERLIEEFNPDGVEDTSKMLKAGAKRAFKIRSNHNELEETFIQFIELVGTNSVIVCESNSLMDFVKPDLFLMIKSGIENKMKPSAARLQVLANRIITTDGVNHDFSADELQIVDSKWILK